MEEEVQEVQVPPVSQEQFVQPVQEASPVPKKKSKLPLVVILVIVILLIAAGAVYAEMQLKGKQLVEKSSKEVVPTTVVEPSLVPTLVPTVDETANWKTYTSERNKYSFSYPKDWFITSRELHAGGINGDVAIESNQKDELVVLAQKEGFGLAPDEGILVSDKAVNIDGLQGKEYISKDLISIRVKKGDIWFLISYKFDALNKTKSIGTFDQILSTFKFLD